MALSPDLTPSELLSAIATDYLADTTLREAPLLGILAANGIMQPQKPIEWGAKVGQAVVGGRTVGGALASDANGTTKGAALSIADYLFKHQFDVIKRDLVNAANTGKITAVRNPINVAVQDAVNEIVRKINTTLYTGNGTADATNFGVVGLNTAIAQTGNYAGISRSTFSRWRSIVQAGATPGTPEALSNTRVDALLRSRRAAGAASNGMNPGLIAVTSDEIEKGALRSLYTQIVNEQSMYEQASKDIQPYIQYYMRGIPVISDLDCPANSIYFLNTNKMAVYGFDEREANASNPKVSYIPLRVDNEDTTLYLRIADVSDEHPDVYKLELSLSAQLAVWDLKDGVSVLQDVKNTVP